MVAKSRAEIQRAYRERQKLKNREGWLKKERERIRKTYVPTAQLSRQEKIRRNVRLHTNLTRYRKRQKDAGKEAARAPDVEPMIVRLPFGRSIGGKKRVSRAIRKNKKKINKLETTLKKLRLKHKATLKAIQRLKAERRKNQDQDQTTTPSTPRSMTERDLSQLDQDSAKKIRKQLLMSNAILAEVNEARKDNRKKSSFLHKTIAGHIVKKYRCLSRLSRSTGLSRRTLSKARDKSFTTKREVRSRVVAHYTEAVHAFLIRDDNSRNMPGKADKVKMQDGSVAQKRVLTDYLSNLHAKFVSENPTALISLASFKRIRPAFVLPTAFISRSSCLCTKHQNAALLLKAVKPFIDVSKNPEDFIKAERPIEEMEVELPDEVSFSEWKRVPVAVDDKGEKVKMITKIVENKQAKKDFINHFQKQFDLFSDHVQRMKQQYKEIRRLKEQLPPHQHVVHMDFAENYSCRGVDEVQSAYWSQTQVTLHPTVIYSTTEEGEPASHTSYVYVSNDLNHNAVSVITFVKDLVDKIKEVDPAAEKIHYWTDGPTSQYRNKTIFYLVSHHKSLFGIEAVWNFFEAGHGKGPCDGVGGVTKRSADLAMKSGRCVIQDAEGFFAWTQSDQCNLKSIKFQYISRETCEETAEEVKAWMLKPLKGTMKLHSVIGKGEGKVLVRDTSCYCPDCLAGVNMCAGWKEESVQEAVRINAREHAEEQAEHQAEQPEEPAEQEAVTEEPREPVEVDDFVAATYENDVYIGKVLEVDLSDELCYKISFLERKKSQYQWPRRCDVIWCPKESIKFHVCEPLPSGKSKRLLKLAPEDRRKLDELVL